MQKQTVFDVGATVRLDIPLEGKRVTSVCTLSQRGSLFFTAALGTDKGTLLISRIGLCRATLKRFRHHKYSSDDPKNNVELLQSLSAAPDGIESPVTKILHMALTNKLYVVVAGQLFTMSVDPEYSLVSYDECLEPGGVRDVAIVRWRRGEFPAVPTISEALIDIETDVTVSSVPSAIGFIAVLFDSIVKLYSLNNTYCEEISLTMLRVPAPASMFRWPTESNEERRCTWFGPLLCLYSAVGGSAYDIYAVDTLSTVSSIPSTEGSTRKVGVLATLGKATTSASHALCACPLQHSFDFNDGTGSANYLFQFAVLEFIPEQFFRYHVVIYSSVAYQIQERRRFPLISVRTPSSMCAYGPWLFVTTNSGLDVYHIGTGEIVQSLLETEDLDPGMTSLFSRALMSSTSSAAVLCNNSSCELIVSKHGIFAFVLYPLSQIMADLLPDINRYATYIEYLQQFAHSVGVPHLTPAISVKRFLNASFTSALINPQLLAGPVEDEYDLLLSKFAVCEDNSSPPAARLPASTKCVSCGTPFIKVLRPAYRCSICADSFCDNCAPVRDSITTLGLNSAKNVRVCNNCYRRCDENLRLLLMYEKFADAIGYVATVFPLDADPSETTFAMDVVGPTVLQRCADRGKLDLCARLLRTVIGQDAMEWERWIMQFAMNHATAALASQIPVLDEGSNSNSSIPRPGAQHGEVRAVLEPWVYTTVLSRLVKQSPKDVFRTLKSWPIAIFHGETVANGIEAQLHSKQQEAQLIQRACCQKPVDEAHERWAVGAVYLGPQIDNLLACLRHIFEALRRPWDVVRVHVEHYIVFLPSPDVLGQTRPRSRCVWNDCIMGNRSFSQRKNPFDIWDYMNLHSLSDLLLGPDERRYLPYTGPSLLLPLIPTQSAKLVKYVVSRADDVLIDSIVAQLHAHPRVLIELLHALGTESIHWTAKYHGLQAQLYVEHKPEALLQFLKCKSVSSVEWRKLAERVQQRRMFGELAYILGRMGDHKEAIRVIVRCLKNVRFVVEYIEEAQDDSLWEEAIKHIIQSPKLIGDCLDCIGGHYDVATFLRRIPSENHFVIPHIGPRLAHVFDDLTLSLSVATASAEVFDGETVDELRHLLRKRNGALWFDPGSQRCSVCRNAMTGMTAGVTSSAVVFAGCGHLCHMDCFTHRFSVLPRPIAATITFRDIHSRMDKKKQNLSFAMKYYSVQRESGNKDIADILPPFIFVHILQYVQRKSRRSLAAVSPLWQKRVAESGAGQLLSAHRIFKFGSMRPPRTVMFGDESFICSDENSYRCLQCYPVTEEVG